jgi:hypothetical protein
MTAISDLSQLINILTGGGAGAPQKPFMLKTNRVDAALATAPVVGQFTSLWLYEGCPSGGAAPGSVRIPTNATVGAHPLANPGGGRQLWLTAVEAAFNFPGVLLGYDRLLDDSGLSATVTTAQTVGGTLTRSTGGAGNQIAIEIFALIGTTATTVTASYTNQDGTAGRTTLATAIGGTGAREAQRLIFLPLADGDTGVRSVESITLAASTGTAGDIGVLIIKPLATLGLNAAGAGTQDYISGIPRLPEIDSGACIAWAILPATVNALVGEIAIAIAEN